MPYSNSFLIQFTLFLYAVGTASSAGSMMGHRHRRWLIIELALKHPTISEKNKGVVYG